MINHLHDALLNLECLPPKSKKEAATYIDAIEDALRHESVACTSTKEVQRAAPASIQWQDPFGAWRDLPDTMLDELDQLRHSSPPTPPLEL